MKKDKVFTAIISVFALAFLAGVGLCVWEYLSISKTKTAIEKTEKSLKRLANQGESPALTEENLAVEFANSKKLSDAKTQKIVAVKGKRAADFLPKQTADGEEFKSSLISTVNNHIAKIESDKIVLDSDARSFGFSRYLSVKPDEKALPLLGTEQKVVQLLVEKLVGARNNVENTLRNVNLLPADKRVFLWVKGIRREAAELPKKDGATGAPVNKDELSVVPTETSAESGLYRLAYAGNSRGVPFPSLRVPNAVDAVAFQVGFVAPTSVLRDFVSAFSGNGDYPIYIRDIAVSPVSAGDVDAKKNELNPPATVPVPGVDAAPAPAADDFDIFGTASAGTDTTAAAVPVAPAAPVKSVVSPEALSEFWVTLEYVTPVENPVSVEENEEE